MDRYIFDEALGGFHVGDLREILVANATKLPNLSRAGIYTRLDYNLFQEGVYYVYLNHLLMGMIYDVIRYICIRSVHRYAHTLYNQ